MSEVEETLKRIQSHRGVNGQIVINCDGIPIRSTMEQGLTVQYAALCHQLISKARTSIREIEAGDELSFMRMRTKRHEIMIAPDKEYSLVVIQEPKCAVNMNGSK